MDLTKDAREEFEERMAYFKSLASSVQDAGVERLDVYRGNATWDDVRVLGDVIDLVEECVERIWNVV